MKLAPGKKLFVGGKRLTGEIAPSDIPPSMIKTEPIAQAPTPTGKK